MSFFSKFVNINCFLIGDYNLNLIKYGTDNDVTRFLDILFNFNFLPCTTLPTRISNSSATLLDHIYIRQTNTPQVIFSDKIVNGCICTDNTDHPANFLCLPLNNIVSSKKDRPFTRIFSD